jgi:hypothetical protein
VTKSQTAFFGRNQGCLARIVALVAVLTSGVCAAQMPPPTLVPQTITMGFFYNGARLHIEGTAPAGADVAVIIRGNEKDEFFNRKSRQLGILWLNSDRIHIQHVPTVFLSFSSGALDETLSRNEIDRYGLDETAILHRMRCLCRCKCNLTEGGRQTGAQDSLPDDAYRVQLEKEFLKLKEADGAYSTRPRSVKIAPLPDGHAKYLVDLEWPAKFSPGNYKVEVYAYSHSEIIGESAGTLQVAETGFPARMQQLAFGAPWVYGAGAVLIALLAGFATDFCSTKLVRRRRPARGVAASPSPEIVAEPDSERVEDKETETIHHH